MASGCDDFLTKTSRDWDLLEKLARHLPIEYVFEASSKQDNTGEDLSSDVEVAFDPDILQEMPDLWLQELEKAAIVLDEDRIYELLEEIEEEYATVAKFLTSKVRKYAMDEILVMLDSDYIS